jgi:hypothetical protein
MAERASVPDSRSELSSPSGFDTQLLLVYGHHFAGADVLFADVVIDVDRTTNDSVRLLGREHVSLCLVRTPMMTTTMSSVCGQQLACDERFDQSRPNGR